MSTAHLRPLSDGPPVEGSSAKALRQALRPYTRRSDARAIALFALFYAKLIAFVGLALYLDSTFARALCSLAAGAAISSLFVIGHDAGHGCYTTGRRLDEVLGRLAMLPALHNFTLWRIVHNRMHHSDPCVRGINSWSPLAKDEFDALPAWRQALERFYRSPAGLGPYYVVNRWLAEKFMPPAHLHETRRAGQWLDFALLLGFLGTLAVLFAAAAEAIDHLSYGEAWLWGFVAPFVVWNYLMAFTVYIQHTHPRVPWFRTPEDARRSGATQHELSVHMVFPRWFGLISNHIMEHPAHHVNTKVPLYNLAAAQARLDELAGGETVVQRFTPASFLRTMRQCKLYDYEGHRWLRFDGTPAMERSAGSPGERTT